MRTIWRRLAGLGAGLLICGAVAWGGAAEDGGVRGVAIHDFAESLPVQDGGRIKPLRTYASFTLLRLNGKRSVRLEDGRKLSATEWLLDTFFDPHRAADYPVFLVRDAAVLDAIGVGHEGHKKSDRYSFRELQSGLDKLFELARRYAPIDPKERTSVQEQVYTLAGNVDLYSQLLGYMEFARHTIPLGDSERLRAIFGGKGEVSFHEILTASDQLSALFEDLRDAPEGNPDLAALSHAIRAASDFASSSSVLAMIPPDASTEEQEEWLTAADLLPLAFSDHVLSPKHVQVLQGFEALAASYSDDAAFESKLADLNGIVVGLAQARGEYDKVPLELTYYRSKVIPYSLYLYVLGFLVMAFMWVRPRSKTLYGATWAVVVAAVGCLTVGIVMRCMIRERPPVSTLYETLIFVTATATLSGLAVELINRQRIALSAVAVLGMVGMFLANGYETLDKQDTMPSLVAVLDTNFWLATHVTCITFGYAAGMLSAFLASTYLVLKAIGVRRGDKAFYRNLSRMSYGVLCFALIFSLVGTILGGIWANYSWGRFWGWDPKENGALLICITQVAILHARMGGYLRQHGVAMATAFMGTVIAFSWFGVNLLGVGLHSYGFTSGIARALWTYYLIQWGIVALGGFTWLQERARLAGARAAEAKAKPTVPEPTA